MIIKDEVLNPYQIMVDYNGFHVEQEQEGGKVRNFMRFDDLNGAMLDIHKRKVAATDITLSLQGYADFQESTIKGMQEATKPSSAVESTVEAVESK